MAEKLEFASAPPGHQTPSSVWWSDRALRRDSGSGVSPTGPVSRRAAAPPSHRADVKATNPAHAELAAVVADGGAPADGGSLKGADPALAANSAPGECLSVARYRLLHHTAVSFVASEIIAVKDANILKMAL